MKSTLPTADCGMFTAKNSRMETRSAPVARDTDLSPYSPHGCGETCRDGGSIRQHNNRTVAVIRRRCKFFIRLAELVVDRIEFGSREMEREMRNVIISAAFMLLSATSASHGQQLDKSWRPETYSVFAKNGSWTINTHNTEIGGIYAEGLSAGAEPMIFRIGGDNFYPGVIEIRIDDPGLAKPIEGNPAFIKTAFDNGDVFSFVAFTMDGVIVTALPPDQAAPWIHDFTSGHKMTVTVTGTAAKPGGDTDTFALDGSTPTIEALAGYSTAHTFDWPPPFTPVASLVPSAPAASVFQSAPAAASESQARRPLTLFPMKPPKVETAWENSYYSTTTATLGLGKSCRFNYAPPKGQAQFSGFLTSARDGAFLILRMGIYETLPDDSLNDIDFSKSNAVFSFDGGPGIRVVSDQSRDMIFVTIPPAAIAAWARGFSGGHVMTVTGANNVILNFPLMNPAVVIDTLSKCIQQNRVSGFPPPFALQ
jgi:hypothetical protein